MLIPLSTEMIQQILQANPGARLASFYGLRLYDVARVQSGTALNQNEFELFATPVGQQTTEMNGTTQYTKTKIDTNMRRIQTASGESGSVDYGYSGACADFRISR
jgi:hypothetical protein